MELSGECEVIEWSEGCERVGGGEWSEGCEGVEWSKGGVVWRV